MLPLDVRRDVMTLLLFVLGSSRLGMGSVGHGSMAQSPFPHHLFTRPHGMPPGVTNNNMGVPTSSTHAPGMGPHDHMPMSPPTPGPGVGNPVGSSANANHVSGNQGLMGLTPPAGGSVGGGGRARGIKSYHCRMCDQVSQLLQYQLVINFK